MKLYTKTGDDGQTGLIGGSRVSKDHLRVEAYGTVDELNAALGFAACGCESEADRHTRELLERLQHVLFDLGADLAHASLEESEARVTAAHAEAIEVEIDRVDGPLPELHNFILPGGCELAGRLHLARTICRRAERRVVSLQQDGSVGVVAVVLLNRLGDLLFALARLANQNAGVNDVTWNPNQ